MPSIGKDLAAIRSHLGYSVEDVQEATKIPLVTLKSIEDGSIFEQTDEIKTYVRSFVRSYGRAIKLDDDLLVEALNQQEAGKYNHLLLSKFPELQPKETNKTEPTPEKEKKKEPVKPPVKKESTPKESKSSDSISSELKEPPGIRSVDWQDVGRRFTAEKKKAPIWITATVVVVIILFGTIYFLSSNGMFTADDSEQEPEANQETPSRVEGQTGGDLSLDLTDEPQDEEAPAELDDVLSLTLYAATDKLDPVRVFSDEKPRMDPYWIDQGQAFNFSFRDTIRIRGQYSRILLFLNGHLIEDPRQESFDQSENAIELTRDIFEDDPKWAKPTDLELELPEGISPPDSIIDRPSF